MVPLSLLLSHPVHIVSFFLLLFLGLNILGPVSTFGGYGMILWSWHPILMSIAFVWLMPIALINQRIASIHHRLTTTGHSIVPVRTFHRSLHSLLMICSVITVSVGYYIAFDIHARKGKVHIPFHKGWVRTLHVLFGISVVIFLLYQCLIGICQYFTVLRRFLLSTTIGRSMAVLHTNYGHYFWYGGILTYILGLYIMFVQNNSSWGNFFFCSFLLGFQVYLLTRSIFLYHDDHSDEYLRTLVNLNFLWLLKALVWSTSMYSGNSQSFASPYPTVSSLPTLNSNGTGSIGGSIPSDNEYLPSIDPEKEKLTVSASSASDRNHISVVLEEKTENEEIIRTKEEKNGNNSKISNRYH